VKVILPRTCRYPTDVNTTSAGGDGGAPAPASAKSASRTGVVVVVVVVMPVTQEYHRAQGEARVGQREIENSREYYRSQL
jgi:cell division GTPase FtsZ